MVRDACPACGVTRCKQNGHTYHGKQSHHCKVCGRQFEATAEHRVIPHAQRTLIERLLRERLSFRGSCRAGGVSLTGLLHFMVECFVACPDHFYIQQPQGPIDVVMHQLEAEADEMGSFVTKRASTHSIWSAMDAKMRQIIALYVGDRSRDSAKELWALLLVVYREQATLHMDQYAAYQDGIPVERHQAITKKPGKPITWNAFTIR